ncbi:MAG: deoxyribose-phosphate aldolase [Acidobacteria bacterium]|nr:deoxyribose-phosphate aldolase [Acidobacteriota bacterium]
MSALLETYESLAAALDHTLLAPELTEEQTIAGCEQARSSRIGAVTVRPCDADTALRLLENSGVQVASVSGFPHGSTTTAAKLYETRDLLRRGVRRIRAVVNISKLLSRQFQFVETELLQLAEACHKEGALLEVVFENAWMSPELKIVGCRLCVRAGADFVSTSTGFGPSGYALEDLRLLRQRLPETTGIRAAGVETLEQAVETFGAGAAAIGTPGPALILEAWKLELKQREAAAAPPAGGA